MVIMPTSTVSVPAPLKSGGGARSSVIGSGGGARSGATSDIIYDHAASVADDRAWAETQAQKQRDWSEMMSSTAYQRAVKDLKAAGLNPALAYSQGGASTPTSPHATTSSTSQSAAITREGSVVTLLGAVIGAVGRYVSSAGAIKGGR